MVEYKWQWGKGRGGKDKRGKGGKGASFAAECYARDARAAAAGGGYVLNGDE